MATPTVGSEPGSAVSEDVGLVDLFLVGPPKTASSWMHACLYEHPEVTTSSHNAIRYFDNFFYKGADWYHGHFDLTGGNRLAVDPTQSYLWSQWAPRRIVEYNPNAKIVVCLRDPIDRAFSHFWHLYKTKRIGWTFDEVLSNANTFELFLAPGFVADKVRFFQQNLPAGHVKLVWFDAVGRDPQGQFAEICRFAGIDPAVRPAAVERRINAARPEMTLLRRALNKAGRSVYGRGFEDRARRSRLARALSGKGEYLDGVPEATRRELIELYRGEIASLEHVTGADLDAWRR